MFEAKVTFLLTLAIITCQSARIRTDDGDNKMMSKIAEMAKDQAAMMLGSQGDGDKGADDSADDEWTPIMAECNETFRISMDYLSALNDSGTFPDETDKTPMCFIRCLLEKAGVASSEGEYNPMRAADVFSKERTARTHDDLEDTARTCSTRTEKCKCERAYNFMSCLIQTDIEKHEKDFTG